MKSQRRESASPFLRRRVGHLAYPEPFPACAPSFSKRKEKNGQSAAHGAATSRISRQLATVWGATEERRG